MDRKILSTMAPNRALPRRHDGSVPRLTRKWWYDLFPAFNGVRLGWPRARDGTSRSWAWDGTRHFSITRARPTGLLRIPGPSHIIQSITRAHPILTFGFPVPSHPMTGMGPGRDGTCRATDIPSLCFWPVPNPLIG